MKVPFLDLKRQYETIRDEVLDAIHAVLESQNFILGDAVEKLEEEISRYCGSPNAIGVASGSDAILISVMALDLEPGAGVITTPFTFFATAGSISRLGCIPIFVDIDPLTFNLDPNKLREFIETRCGLDRKGQLLSRDKKVPIRAVLPVHLFGQSADMDPILELCRKNDLGVIEDAAQAIGSSYKPTSDQPGRFAGTMGEAGCFSFYPSKNLGAFGDGGMVICKGSTLADKIRILRAHGSRPKYYHRVVGLNSRLDAIQAVILRVKLKYLDQWSEARRQNALQYDRLFRDLDCEGIGISLPFTQYQNHHIFNQYVIRVSRRDGLREFLQKHSIGTDIYYPLPLHLQECYRHLGHREGDFPVAEEASRTVLALPIFPEITTEEQRYVVKKIGEFYRS
ncbi:MAG: transcriptional regulator [Proteobacteria bacterium]|nr:transcriptional regulator [Pseudomonadota bacterium]